MPDAYLVVFIFCFSYVSSIKGHFNINLKSNQLCHGHSATVSLCILDNIDGLRNDNYF